jgi:hypothetical protein
LPRARKLNHGRYASKYAALRIDAQGPDEKLHPATGRVIGHQKPLVAEFGILGPEFVPRDENGEPLAQDQYGGPFTSASIRGFYWDSEQAQKHNGWSDDEAETVLALVELFCRQEPGMVWRLEAPVLTAPWPTFDSQTDQAAAAVAIETGQVDAALAYARQQERTKTVALLEAHQAEQAAEAEAEQALTV